MEILTCEACKKEILKNYNFCPYCGKAISDVAKRLNKEKYDLIKIKLINEVCDQISDKKTLEILSKMTNSLLN